MRLDIVG